VREVIIRIRQARSLKRTRKPARRARKRLIAYPTPPLLLVVVLVLGIETKRKTDSDYENDDEADGGSGD
jgi:hypothetical protein